jgi:hypothetical protein
VLENHSAFENYLKLSDSIKSTLHYLSISDLHVDPDELRSEIHKMNQSITENFGNPESHEQSNRNIETAQFMNQIREGIQEEKDGIESLQKKLELLSSLGLQLKSKKLHRMFQ